MGDKSNIEWTDATWNPIRARDRETRLNGWACVRVSPGCEHCYAETMNVTQRFGLGTGHGYTVPALAQVEHYLDEAFLTAPLRWRKPRRVFLSSMTDIFGEWVTDDMLDRVFAVMALTPQHTYQVLTKRPTRMRDYLTDGHQYGPPTAWERISRIAWEQLIRVQWPLPNVWLGVSVEDQQRADERIPILRSTPAAVRFVSCEPLLGPVDLRTVPIPVNGPRDLAVRLLDWIIVGGESSPRARPFDLAWARSLLYQCQAAGVAFFLKQLGAHVLDRNDAGFDGGGGDEWPEEMRTSGWHDAMYQGENVRVHLRNPHGADPDEWPVDLLVREFPAVAL